MAFGRNYEMQGSGFLIKFFKDFCCLISNQHIITKEMIENKSTILFGYDEGRKSKEIKLDPEERIIKEFTL